MAPPTAARISGLVMREHPFPRAGWIYPVASGELTMQTHLDQRHDSIVTTLRIFDRDVDLLRYPMMSWSATTSRHLLMRAPTDVLLRQACDMAAWLNWYYYTHKLRFLPPKPGSDQYELPLEQEPRPPLGVSTGVQRPYV